MGNERRFGSPKIYPAAIPDVIAVGATRPDDRVAGFSNRGSHITVVAPGAAIWSTLPTYPGNTGFDANHGGSGTPLQGKPHYRETDYDCWDGTSMAAPHVTAAIAMLLGKRGPMTLPDVMLGLKSTSDKVLGMDGAEFDQDYGFGRLNLLRLLQ